MTGLNMTSLSLPPRPPAPTGRGASARSSRSPVAVTDTSRTSGSSVAHRLEAHRHELGAERRRHHVAPLDEHHRVIIVQQLAEREVGHLGQSLQPVDVGVVDPAAAPRRRGRG